MSSSAGSSGDSKAPRSPTPGPTTATGAGSWTRPSPSTTCSPPSANRGRAATPSSRRTVWTTSGSPAPDGTGNRRRPSSGCCSTWCRSTPDTWATSTSWSSWRVAPPANDLLRRTSDGEPPMLGKVQRSVRIAALTASVLALAGIAFSRSATAPTVTAPPATTASAAPTAAATPPPATGPSPATEPSPRARSAPTSKPAPTPTSTSWTCSAALGDSCGAYDFAGIPNSNGYNTYVSNQAVGAQPGTTQTVYANSPADWKLVANSLPYGYLGVQTFPDVQQLFDNWCGSGWTGCPEPTSTPLNALATLEVTYSETSPTDQHSIYEFAVDAWSENYGSDVMFWTDTRGRCDEGAFGGTLLGRAVLDGQGWTVHRYGGSDAEIIFVLDGAGGSGTCARQASGTVDVKAGFDWLAANGFTKGPQRITQLNTGWEITSAGNSTFTMHGYSIAAVPTRQ